MALHGTGHIAPAGVPGPYHATTAAAERISYTGIQPPDPGFTDAVVQEIHNPG